MFLPCFGVARPSTADLFGAIQLQFILDSPEAEQKLPASCFQPPGRIV